MEATDKKWTSQAESVLDGDEHYVGKDIGWKQPNCPSTGKQIHELWYTLAM